MKKFLNQHLITIATYSVVILIIISVSLTFYNKNVMRNSLNTLELTDNIRKVVDRTFLNIRQMDISSRGYAIMQEESFLFYSVDTARVTNKRNFQELDSLLNELAYSDPKNYAEVKAGFIQYVNMYEDMVSKLKAGDIEAYKDILAEDFGKTFWPVMDRFRGNLEPYLTQLQNQANENYESAILRNTITQILLLIIGLPTLLFMVIKLRRDERKRISLLLNLRDNNKKYLFDDGDRKFRGAEKILNNSIKNLREAAKYVNKISDGEYDHHWEGLTEDNKEYNQDNLAGRLIKMKEKMLSVDRENKRRIWNTEGLSKLSEIIRNTDDSIKELTYECTRYLVDYLDAQQGSTFIFKKEDEDNPNDEGYLELTACYAFDKRKYNEKRIAIGQGLVGQIYLEKETLHLTEIPTDYTYIKSGLGDETPTTLLIVPLLYNENVQGVLEFASFKEYDDHEIEFIEKAGEYVASAIATTHNNERTKIMVEKLQTQAEEMRAQEEELRQNMEELEATQEEMRRKEKFLMDNE